MRKVLGARMSRTKEPLGTGWPERSRRARARTAPKPGPVDEVLDVVTWPVRWKRTGSVTVKLMNVRLKAVAVRLSAVGPTWATALASPWTRERLAGWLFWKKNALS